MFARTLSLLALAACTPPAPDRVVDVSPALATLRIGARGAIASYDVSADQWIVATSTERALVTLAKPSSAAGPDAFAHNVVPGATVLARESLSDGFAVTLESGGTRATYVVKELGARWITCAGSVALCRSLKRR